MSDESPKIYPIEVAGKWGFIDELGNVIIEPRYGVVRHVNDGVIWVNPSGTQQYMILHSGGKWGLIDTRGTVLVEPSLALLDLNDFSDGVAWVRQALPGQDKAFWGLIDKTGAYIIPPELEFDISWKPSVFNDGVSMIHANGKTGIVDKEGGFILQPGKYNNVSWFQGDRAWVHEGGEADAGYWGDGIVGGKWGLIDRQGTIVVEPRYDDHHAFSDGVAWVNREGKREEPGLIEPWPECTGGSWGLIDADGNLLIDFTFEKALDFNDEKALVKQSGKWGWIDKHGSFLARFDQDLDELNQPSDGLILAKSNGKYGFIDESGEIVLELIHDTISGYGSIKWVKASTKWLIFNQQDRTLVEPEIPCELDFSWSDGYAEVSIGGKHGLMDSQGRMVGDAKFSSIHAFMGGTAWVNLGGTYEGLSGLRGGKWGLVDTSGEYVVEPVYDDIFEMASGDLTEVKIGNNWGYVNHRGEKIWFYD